MVDSGPYPSDGEGRPSRKPRHDQRSGRTGAQDRESEHHDGRGNGRNREERSQNRDRRQGGEDRGSRRPREDVGRDQYQKTEQYREERGQRDRGRDREDRGHSRSHPEKSRYKDREDYQSEKSYNQHQGRDYQSEKSNNQHQGRDYQSEKSYNQHQGRDYQSEKSNTQHQGRDYQSEKSNNQHQGREDYRKERSPNRYEERERPHVRYADSPDRRSYPMDSKVTSERSFPPNGAEMHELEYYEESGGGILDCHKCKYLCTGRACCQLVEVLLNMLILICCAVSYNSTGGYTGISSLGGIYYYQFGGAYNGFSGADGEKAQALDVEFYNLKLPSVRASMAFGGALMAFCCLLVLLGVLRVPWRWPVWLLVECVLNVAIAIGFIPALYFYFQRLQEAYNSQVCQDREALYSSKGYKGFTCGFHAGDIGAALFACMAIIVFSMSAVLAVRGFRSVRQMKRKPVNTLEF